MQKIYVHILISGSNFMLLYHLNEIKPQSTSLHLVLLISEGIGMNCHRIDLRFRGRSMLGINFNFFERVKGVETVDQFSKYGVLKYNLYICRLF